MNHDPRTFCVHGAPMTAGTLHGDKCEPMSNSTGHEGF